MGPVKPTRSKWPGRQCVGDAQRSVAAMLGVLLAVCWACPAAAVQSATAVGLDLHERPIRIHRLVDGALRFFDDSRQLCIEPIGRFVQLRIDAPDEDHASRIEKGAAELSLIDGQRIVGAWLGADEDGQVLRFRHAVLGPINVPLDRIRYFVPSGRATPTGGSVSELAAVDQVRLVNGDVLEGFVASVHTSLVRMRLAGGAEPVDLPFARVRSVRLANDAQPQPTAVDRLILRDGSCVYVSRLRIESDNQLTFSRADGSEPRPPDTSIDLSRVSQIDLGRSGLQLVDLLELPRRVVAGGEVFGVPMPPRVLDEALWLHAPVTVRFDLPAAAVRFAVQVEIQTGRDDDMSPWSDLIVHVAVDGKAQAHTRLHAGVPSVALGGSAEGRSLTIELDPGLYGPVMDRILLRRAAILVVRQP